jgi:hypothetical protein
MTCKSFGLVSGEHGGEARESMLVVEDHGGHRFLLARKAQSSEWYLFKLTKGRLVN